MLARGGRFSVCSRNSASTNWFAKETSLKHRLSLQCRGKSNAASPDSDIPHPRKARKWVSKNERRAMMEAFVNEYREANAGKFPTVSKAMKEIGGSNYFLRRILQEMQYKSKLDPSISEVKQPAKIEPKRSRRSVAEVEGIPAQERADAVTEDVADSVSFRDSMNSENPGDGGTTTHEFVKPAAEGINPDLPRQGDENVSYPHERPHDAGKEVRDDLLDIVSDQSYVKEETKDDGEIHKSTQFRATEVDSGRAEVPKGPSDSDSPHRLERQLQGPTDSDRDTESSQKPSLWENLKSFADGFISIWRNR